MCDTTHSYVWLTYSCFIWIFKYQYSLKRRLISEWASSWYISSKYDSFISHLNFQISVMSWERTLIWMSIIVVYLIQIWNIHKSSEHSDISHFLREDSHLNENHRGIFYSDITYSYVNWRFRSQYSLKRGLTSEWESSWYFSFRYICEQIELPVKLLDYFVWSQ